MDRDEVLKEIMSSSADAVACMFKAFLEAENAKEGAEICQMVMSAGISMIAESITILDKVFHPQLADETVEQTDARRADLVKSLQVIIASLTKIPMKADSDVPYEAAVQFATLNTQRWAANLTAYPEASTQTAESLTKGMICGLAMSILGPAGTLAERLGAEVNGEEVLDSATSDAVDVLCEAAQRVNDKWSNFFYDMVKALPDYNAKKVSRGV